LKKFSCLGWVLIDLLFILFYVNKFYKSFSSNINFYLSIFSGLKPNKPVWFTIASGWYPFYFSKWIGEVGSLFDNFLPSWDKRRGKCINFGG